MFAPQDLYHPYLQLKRSLVPIHAGSLRTALVVCALTSASTLFSPQNFFSLRSFYGEMPEWPIGAVSKTVIRASGSRVRIPVSPPIQSPAQQHSKSEGAPDVSSECGGGFVVCFAKQRAGLRSALAAVCSCKRRGFRFYFGSPKFYGQREI